MRRPLLARAVRPSQLTTIFACNDDEALYIAFNCAENDIAARRISRSNYVRYDDLWPAGDDLVEIVIDPTGQAVGPGDLLHGSFAGSAIVDHSLCRES